MFWCVILNVQKCWPLLVFTVEQKGWGSDQTNRGEEDNEVC